MEGLIEIHEYLDATEAELVKAKLVSLGISAEVFVDDLGRQGPRRGRLLVPAELAEEACDLLGFELPVERPPGFFVKNAALLLLVIVALAAAGAVTLFTR